MYLIADTTVYELPLAVCNDLKELAKVCKSTIPAVCRVIRKERITKMFAGTPARIFKIEEKEL